MMNNRPLFTKTFHNFSEFTPEPNSTYIYGETDEPRASLVTKLTNNTLNIDLYKIHDEDKYQFACDGQDQSPISLRNRDSISNFLSRFKQKKLYIDITGLGHPTWAALVRCALEDGMVVRVVYTEPRSYLRNVEPKMGDIFDLSLRISGIDQLPMFPSFHDFEDERSCFVPLLGFEGTRFAHMFENVQPEDRKTFPIIGVPGFRQEYPFSSYLGNANTLQRSESFTRTRFARSDCPFSLYYKIEDLATEFPDHVIKLGLIGTKPHALGALLFAMKHNDRSEIIYDHVIKKPGRTDGAGKCLVFAVSEFMEA